MKRRLLKTMAAVLAIAAAAAGPVRGQNSTTYNVTFGGFNEPDMNTTVNVASLPHTFTGLGDYSFVTFTVISEDCDDFTSASVTSGGEGKVSANMPNSNQMTITVSGTFEGTATIHVTGIDDNENPVSCDVTVSCVSSLAWLLNQAGLELKRKGAEASEVVSFQGASKGLPGNRRGSGPGSAPEKEVGWRAGSLPCM